MQFENSYGMLVLGPTNCGKTSWLTRLLTNVHSMHRHPIRRVIFCYDRYQPMYNRMRAQCPLPIEFYAGLPEHFGAATKQTATTNITETPPADTLLILDDLMMKVDLVRLAHLFTNGRQYGLNPILVLHNLTHKGKKDANALLTINRNCGYRVLFSFPADLQNIRTIQTQMFPHLPGFLMDVYQDACCETPYGYVVLDSRPNSDNYARAYTRIWPGEQTQFYLPPNHQRQQLTIPGGVTVPIDYNF